ncbi:ABC transporter permease [Geopsychrobacter electrodiphilus]|uniref:ABC transporter permease n=1 Tax=Geopsychrobacter electrodiphilus TaxID=225196 RepID=UPI000370217C|nr:ABC transporter permease [Geopsychrobacter electrodiphilus]
MPNLKILEYSLASLLRRPGKTCAILVVYTLMIAVLSSVLLLTEALKSEATATLAGGPQLIVQRLMAGRHELIAVAEIDKLAKIPGVKGIKPRVWGYYYDSLTKMNFTMQGIDTAASQLSLLSGRLPRGEDECAIGAGIAENRRIGLEDDLILIDNATLGRSFTVTGVFTAASDLLTQDLIVMPTETLHQFFGMPEGYATDLAVEVYNSNEINTIAGKIKLALPDSRPITQSELLRTYHAVFDWRGGMLLALFSSALMAFCILAWDKATGLSAGERREIGILKAVGWDTSDVLLLKLWEGLALSLLAFLVGYLMAFVLVFFWGAPLLGSVLRGWSVLFPALHPTPFIDPYQIATLAFLTIVPYVASTVIPAWRAAVTDPDEVMRA